ncbi:MAG: substrate-binding domain-containing protein, partial [Spirochaetales bacterium]|nr:substrate-binding domain-containing protein [Spirochaetales bacterium]
EEPVGVDLMRLRGVQSAFSENNITWTDDLFFPLSRSKQTRHELYQHIYEEISSWTALFFASDYYAAEAAVFFSEKGVRIPEDISLVGFDDNFYARMVQPSLTTMRQDVKKKGQLAIKRLLKLIKDEEVQDINTRFEPELIIRNSTKKREENYGKNN